MREKLKKKEMEQPYHIEAKEAVTEKHLDFLIMGWEVPMRIAAGVLVDPSPLISRWSKLVGSQGTGTRCETACQNDALLPIPLLVVLEDLSMRSKILHNENKKEKRKKRLFLSTTLPRKAAHNIP